MNPEAWQPGLATRWEWTMASRCRGRVPGTRSPTQGPCGGQWRRQSPGVGIVDHGHRLPGSVIGQAEKDQVGGV